MSSILDQLDLYDISEGGDLMMPQKPGGGRVALVEDIRAAEAELQKRVAELEREISRIKQEEEPKQAEPAKQAASVAVPEGWREPTTFLKRFGDAVQLLCQGRRPSDALLLDWLDPNSEGFYLQCFCADNTLGWAQGIAVLDAARIMADQPTEGVDHELSDNLTLVTHKNGARQLIARAPDSFELRECTLHALATPQPAVAEPASLGQQARQSIFLSDTLAASGVSFVKDGEEVARVVGGGDGLHAAMRDILNAETSATASVTGLRKVGAGDGNTYIGREVPFMKHRKSAALKAPSDEVLDRIFKAAGNDINVATGPLFRRRVTELLLAEAQKGGE